MEMNIYKLLYSFSQSCKYVYKAYAVTTLQVSQKLMTYEQLPKQLRPLVEGISEILQDGVEEFYLVELRVPLGERDKVSAIVVPKIPEMSEESLFEDLKEIIERMSYGFLERLFPKLNFYEHMYMWHELEYLGNVMKGPTHLH